MPAGNTTPREFEELVAPHLDALSRTAIRLLHDASEAEDLVQDALLRAYRFFDRFERGSNFKAWIFRVLLNTFVNGYRSRKRKATVLPLDSARGVEDENGPETEIAAFVGLVEGDRSRLYEQIDDRIRAALDELPSALREVFELSVLEDLKYREIAEVLDCPVGTVMSRLFRARSMLRQRLVSLAAETGMKTGETDLQEESRRDGPKARSGPERLPE